MDYHYEYVGTYDDDLKIASTTPEKIIEQLEKDHKFKLKGTGDLTYHLGVSFHQDPDGTLCQSAIRYVMKMIEEYKGMYGESRLSPKLPICATTACSTACAKPSFHRPSTIYYFLKHRQWTLTMAKRKDYR